MPLDPLLQSIVDGTPREMPAPQGPAPEDRPSRLQMALQSGKDAIKGLNRGMTTDLVGAPVDIINTILRGLDDTRLLPQRFSTSKPVGGSDWLQEKLVKAGLASNDAGSPSEAAGRLLGGFVNPTSGPMVMGVLIGARGVKNAGKAAQVRFELGRQALEAGEDAAQVHRKYGVSKTKEGDLAYEIPLRETEAGALQQFKEHYPDVTLRVLRNQGERSGYFYAPENELFAQGRVGGDITKPESRRRVLEHELQHAVDALEGRSHGASPGVNYLNKAWEDPQYWKNAAEVRARAVEQRLDPEMRAFPPQVNEGVPREQQIIKQDPRAVMEAVKEPGGMWHPEAVERLASPLAKTLRGNGADQLAAMNQRFDALREQLGRTATPEELEKAFPSTDAWSQRAIRNYLNKYAGTTRDPLKDVEIPFGEGMKRWEELTDAAILPRDATSLKGKEMGLREGEVGHTFAGSLRADTSIPEAKALTSYLSHVGDYLRQNVAPEKLAQYDLVRAVRETAANDARMARESAKAAQASMKDLPVHKEYPTGFKWVELKKPEKLTEEQMKGVREVPGNHLEGNVPPHTIEGQAYPDKAYVAVDAKGKPIRNSYTETEAVEHTPERAWLAGRLAEEGNTMGHCVGGYCDPVASGESKIFSLRGPDGKSHVTVEVAPPDVRSADNTPVAFYKQTDPQTKMKFGKEPVFGEVKGESEGDWTRRHRFWKQEIFASPEYRKWLSVRSSDIIQIKGKANRAPNKEYLPYVQDFVRSGKWGEVGDLRNTGLVKHGNKYHTREELRPIVEEWARKNPYVRGPAGLTARDLLERHLKNIDPSNLDELIRLMPPQ